ncbi:hypothetical protein EXU34_21610 [Alteromonas sp. ZYF713]|nr:hypothetical protein [Alteromonas sp. ZYF713]
MKKYLLLCFITLFLSAKAQASFIHEVSGADMAGILVEVAFADGTTDSGVWVAMSPTAGGYINGVWGIRLDGDSHGVLDNANNILSGMFVLVNNGNTDIMSLTLRAFNAGFVFDSQTDDIMLNGSGTGRGMYSANPSAVASYTDLYMDELYGTMMISSTRALAEAGNRVAFVTDIDAIAITQDIPAPTGGALSLLFLAATRLTRNARV